MTTNFNPSSAKGKNFEENWVNTMAVDVLPPYVTSSLAVTVLTKYSLLMHCIKIKSPAKFLLNEQYVFVGGNISFLCVLSCSSEEAQSTWLWIKWFVKQNET